MHTLEPNSPWRLPTLCVGAAVVSAMFIFATWDRYGVLAALPLVLSAVGFGSMAWRNYAEGNRRWVEISLYGMILVTLWTSVFLPLMLPR